MSEENILHNETAIFFEGESFQLLKKVLSDTPYSQTFVLVDENTKKHCLPLLDAFLKKEKFPYQLLSVKAGETSKSLAVASEMWQQLSHHKADRKSLCINLGGGMISDLGGFVASIYKRGIDFINIPTSLLGMVDAAIGGKCGIDFEGLKNQLGVFRNAKYCFIHPVFLKTLPKQELLSGYAEMVKHAFISNEIDLDSFNKIGTMPDADLIQKAVLTKTKIVEQDPFEQGERKKLNFGHTIGHAVESYFLEHKTPVPHGFAVAVGMQCELYLSVKKKLISNQLATKYQQDVLRLFPRIDFGKEAIQPIMSYLIHDKKNESGKLQFVLLNGKGSAIINQEVEESLIRESLEFYIALQ